MGLMIMREESNGCLLPCVNSNVSCAGTLRKFASKTGTPDIKGRWHGFLDSLFISS